MKPTIPQEDLVTLATQLAPLLGGTLSQDQPATINFPDGLSLRVDKGYFKHAGRIQFIWHGLNRVIVHNREELRLYVAPSRSLSFIEKKLRDLKAIAELGLQKMIEDQKEKDRLQERLIETRNRLKAVLSTGTVQVEDNIGLRWKGVNKTDYGVCMIDARDDQASISLRLPAMGIEQAEKILQFGLENGCF